MNSCPDGYGWRLVNEKICVSVTNTTTSWCGAKESCAERNGSLFNGGSLDATPEKATEFLNTEMLTNKDWFWINATYVKNKKMEYPGMPYLLHHVGKS